MPTLVQGNDCIGYRGGKSYPQGYAYPTPTWHSHQCRGHYLAKEFSLDDDGGLSDSDPDPSDDDGCSSEDEQRRSHTSKHSRWSDLDEQRLLAYKLDPQYVHAGIWSGPEATKLPPAGGQEVAQALCAYLSFDICWDECLRKTLSFCRPVHRGSRSLVAVTSECDRQLLDN